MQDSGNLPADFHEYAQVPRASTHGGVLEDLLETHLDELREHGVDIQSSGPLDSALAAKNGEEAFYDDPPETLDPDPVAPDAIDVEIPEDGFLLRSPSGDVYLFPNGLSEEDDFIVLFFDKEKDLFFKPAQGTNFIGAYNLEADQVVKDLFYSGIMFKLPESEQVAVIFHKR